MSSITRFSQIPVDTSANMAFLVSNITAKTDKRGKEFCEIKATDGEQSIIVRLWNHALADLDISAGDVISATVRAVEYNGSMSYSFQSYKKEDPERASEFVLSAPMSISAMWEWVESRIFAMAEPYRSILIETVISNKDLYCHLAAGRSIHHAYIGGLLYHSYRMARAAEALSPIYGTSADLAVAGALLHDIGKLAELSTDVLGHTEYTVEGQMEHHLMIGVRILDVVARKIDAAKFSSDEMMCLRHIVASHHGKQEMGAIVEPATKEAMLISALDMLDMKMTIYDTEAENVLPGNTSTNDNFVVGRIYKPKCTADKD